MRIIASFAVLCLVAMAGCGKRDKKVPDSKPGINITEDGVSVKSEAGSFAIGKGAKVPASFPKDVLVYKKAEILMAMEVASGHQLQLKTPDDKNTVTAAYLKALAAAKWAKQNTVDTGQQVVVNFTKDKRRIALSISQQPDATYVMLVVMKTGA